MSADDRLLEQIHAASLPVYLSEKADLVEYFQDRHGEDWRSELVNGLGEVSDLKRSSLMRRFQGGREYGTRVTPKAREEYEKLGQAIGPVDYEPPPGGYRVRFIGEIKISKKCFPRHFERFIGGEEADVFAHADLEKSDELWEIIFYAYFEDDTAEGYCGEPTIIIEAA